MDELRVWVWFAMALLARRLLKAMMVPLRLIGD
jgi:hypothetical protein